MRQRPHAFVVVVENAPPLSRRFRRVDDGTCCETSTARYRMHQESRATSSSLPNGRERRRSTSSPGDSGRRLRGGCVVARMSALRTFERDVSLRGGRDGLARVLHARDRVVCLVVFVVPFLAGAGGFSSSTFFSVGARAEDARLEEHRIGFFSVGDGASTGSSPVRPRAPGALSQSVSRGRWGAYGTVAPQRVPLPTRGDLSVACVCALIGPCLGSCFVWL